MLKPPAVDLYGMQSANTDDSSKSFPERLQDRLIEFSIAVWKDVQQLPQTQSMARLSDQLIRSATSVAANYAEARAAESRRDFVHKMQICLKELREAAVWLELVKRLDDPEWQNHLAEECDELTRVFVKSIKTARGKGG